jgi:hypothetical protein
MSEIAGNDFAYPAFSGQGQYINKPVGMHIPDVGPIPIGRYVIVDRGCGGRMRCLRDRAASIDPGSYFWWFALYALDGRIDDETFLRGVTRGKFRLHPGTRSEGCVTLPNNADFHNLRNMLLPNKDTHNVDGTQIECYGVLNVTF